VVFALQEKKEEKKTSKLSKEYRKLKGIQILWQRFAGKSLH